MSSSARRSHQPESCSQGHGQEQTSPSTEPDASQCQDAQLPEEAVQTFWRECVREWYPNLHSQTYFVPPLHFSRVQYDLQPIAGQSVLVPQAASDQPFHASTSTSGPPPQPLQPPLPCCVWPDQPAPSEPLPHVFDCDVKEDRAQQHVLQYLRDRAESDKEVMMVISQLQFRHYLDKLVGPISAAANAPFQRPRIGDGKDERGDFDVLIVHRRYGLIVGEIKSVGDDPSKTPDLDMTVVNRVKRAVKQLEKSESVLQNLVSDVAPVNITKAPMLPNVTSQQLLQALRSTSAKVQKDVCRCVGTTDIAEAVSRCLCSDDLTSSDWWRRSVTRNGDDVNMTDKVYETIVARFCGPATTVEVPCVTCPRVEMRTMSQAIAHTGLRMALLTLHPRQVELVNRARLMRVWLRGPPGTGKTVVLIIKGLQWFRQERNVHVLSHRRVSRAAAFLIHRQLLHALGADSTATAASGPRVHLHLYDFDDNKGDVEDAVNTLAAAAQDGQLYIIADEVFQTPSQTFSDFCTRLIARVPALHLWAASVLCRKIPTCMTEERLTAPLRSPPAVLNEVAKSVYIDDSTVPCYTSGAIPAPTDGPTVRWLRHEGQPDHSGEFTGDCERCGDVICDMLDELGVDLSGQGDLQYRDVLVLYGDPRDDLAVVQALRARDVPVRVLSAESADADVRDLALAVKNEVTLTNYDVASGLERRIVIGLGVPTIDASERLDSMSRSTAQLVWIDPAS